jgi:hypothetical protein
MSGRWWDNPGDPHGHHIIHLVFSAAHCQQRDQQPEQGPGRIVVAVWQSPSQDRSRNRAEITNRLSSGATYDTQTIAGQTKATLNSAVNATKSLLHIK